MFGFWFDQTRGTCHAQKKHFSLELSVIKSNKAGLKTNPLGSRCVQKKGISFPYKHPIHPGRLTWNILMEGWKIIFLSKWVICRFHVNLPGCKPMTWGMGCFGAPSILRNFSGGEPGSNITRLHYIYNELGRPWHI